MLKRLRSIRGVDIFKFITLFTFFLIFAAKAHLHFFTKPKMTQNFNKLNFIYKKKIFNEDSYNSTPYIWYINLTLFHIFIFILICTYILYMYISFSVFSYVYVLRN